MAIVWAHGYSVVANRRFGFKRFFSTATYAADPYFGTFLWEPILKLPFNNLYFSGQAFFYMN